ASALSVLAVVDAGDVGVELELETGPLAQHGIEQNFRARLCVRFTDETLAMSAILALAELHPVGVGVGVRGVCRRHRKRLIAETLGRLYEDQPRFGCG